MDTKMDSDFVVEVRCGCCRKTHRIEKGDFYTCTLAANVSGLGGWYILVFPNGEVVQTMHLENVRQTIERFQERKQQEATRKRR